MRYFLMFFVLWAVLEIGNHFLKRKQGYSRPFNWGFVVYGIAAVYLLVA